MKTLFSSLLVITFLLGGCATSVMTSGGVVIEDDETQAGVSITSRDREQIEKYYGQSNSNTRSSGLAKRDVLPANVKNQSLPAALETHLSKLPDGYKRVVVGSDILLIKTGTRVVVDIYRNAGMN
ncbi:MAG: hypothetical protein LJE56_04255 [Acidiferrobacterales bacterium]|jgi:hypothetical protein|nr:hypothetical protein [Acidiferrobacterales bacterium]